MRARVGAGADARLALGAPPTAWATCSCCLPLYVGGLIAVFSQALPSAKPGGNLETKPQTGSFCCENRMIFLSANFTAAVRSHLRASARTRRRRTDARGWPIVRGDGSRLPGRAALIPAMSWHKLSADSPLFPLPADTFLERLEKMLDSRAEWSAAYASLGRV